MPEVWVKILLANQIVRFLNQRYLQKKLMKEPDFLYVIKIKFKKI